LPFLAALFALLFVLIVIPDFTMYLPKAFGFVK
jgi:TRAP-type C4-dicarboxylate transport system permease large subunit